MCPPTRRSHCSTGFDNSVFGSGSSVLSNFEPPSETDPLTRQLMGNIYDAIPKSQQELEAVISNLQAVYLYRQGLKALAEERLTAQSTNKDNWTENGLVQPQTQPLFPTMVPGSMNSIWRMDAEPASTAVPLTAKTTAPEMIDNTDIGLRNQQSMYQELIAGVQSQERVTGHQIRRSLDASTCRRRRRKDHRQNSAPVNLCAPQWADATWNPRLNVRTKQQSTGHGTGVFLPPHLSHSTVMCEEEVSQHQQQ